MGKEVVSEWGVRAEFPLWAELRLLVRRKDLSAHQETAALCSKDQVGRVETEKEEQKLTQEHAAIVPRREKENKIKNINQSLKTEEGKGLRRRS